MVTENQIKTSQMLSSSGESEPRQMMCLSHHVQLPTHENTNTHAFVHVQLSIATNLYAKKFSLMQLVQYIEPPATLQQSNPNSLS